MPNSNHHRDVIVIGASLGGMEALKKLFSHLPRDLNAAVLVVWHVPPESTNLLPAILQRTTELSVHAPFDGQAVEAGHAYIAPPDFHLVVEKNSDGNSGNLRLTRGPKENRFRPSIDVLFRSAAVAFGERVIGVVLTGMLDDGASGLYAIKEYGGLAVVQDPLDAECPHMPISAMRAVETDHVAPISQLGEMLTSLVNETITDGGEPVAEKTPFDQPEPNKLETEVRIALEDNSLERGVIDLGDPSLYTCPECHGILLQIKEGKITRFRCHTGHAYTLDTLIAEVTRSSEDALWNALRNIQETEMLTGHLAKHLSDAGEDEAAQSCLQRMVRAMRQANLVRQATMESETAGTHAFETYQRR